jgi:hypothetical protein
MSFYCYSYVAYITPVDVLSANIQSSRKALCGNLTHHLEICSKIFSELQLSVHIGMMNQSLIQ